MSFLKKFGTVLLKIVGVVSGVGPIFQAAVPQSEKVVTKVTDTFTEIANWVMIIEGAFAGMQGAQGAAKLEAVLPFVAQAIQRSEVLAHHEIMDEAKFTAAVRTISGGVADLLNSLKSDKVDIKKP